MSEPISAAEKRRLLREKRAAKMATGGSRLNKILGTNDEEQNDTTIQPVSAKSTTSVEMDSTKAAMRPNTGKLKNSANRISISMNQNANYDDDPPVSGLDEFEVSLEDDSPLQEFVSNETAELDIEQILNKMLQSSSHDGKNLHNHGQAPHAENVFDKEMASLFAGMNAETGAGLSSSQPFAGMPGMMGTGLKTEVEIAKSKVYQSGFAVFRLIYMWLLVYSNVSESSIPIRLPSIFLANKSLWTQFLYTEIVFGLLHSLFNYLSVFPNNTIMSFDVSSFGYANSALTAYTFARNLFNDFCYLVVILGLASYFSN